VKARRSVYVLLGLTVITLSAATIALLDWSLPPNSRAAGKMATTLTPRSVPRFKPPSATVRGSGGQTDRPGGPPAPLTANAAGSPLPVTVPSTLPPEQEVTPHVPPVPLAPVPAPAAAPPRPVVAAETSVVDPCPAAIAAVEARGLYPAPGFSVTCPGYALGHEGMTCLNVPGVCAGAREIVIHYPEAFVVANEFENSRILSGMPARCHTIDCGSIAYGY
jgi:hypothetical protein